MQRRGGDRRLRLRGTPPSGSGGRNRRRRVLVQANPLPRPPPAPHQDGAVAVDHLKARPLACGSRTPSKTRTGHTAPPRSRIASTPGRADEPESGAGPDRNRRHAGATRTGWGHLGLETEPGLQPGDALGPVFCKSRGLRRPMTPRPFERPGPADAHQSAAGTPASTLGGSRSAMSGALSPCANPSGSARLPSPPAGEVGPQGRVRGVGANL